MHRWLLVAGWLLCSLAISGQPTSSTFFQKARLLSQEVAQASNDSLRVSALGRLAFFYYIYKATAKGDSVLNEQLLLAERSENSNLLFSVLFSYSANNIDAWNSVGTFDRALEFVEKGLAYARQSGRKDYETLALVRKAAILRNRGRHDAALEQAVQAGIAMEKAPNDSVRAVLLLETGDIFLAKGNAVTAYQHYNNAWDLAYAGRNPTLLTQANHHIALLYKQLGRPDLSEQTLKASLAQNQQTRNATGVLYDYVDLARVTDKKEYIEKAILLSDSLGSERNLLFAKQLMQAYYMVVEKNSRKALDYMYRNPDLHQLQLNRGTAQYNWQIGYTYYYGNQPDSAIRYFNAAAPALQNTLDDLSKIDLNRDMGNCLVQLGKPVAALPYLMRAKELANNTNTLLSNRDLLLQLSQAQAATGDYKAAFETEKVYLNYLDSAAKKGSERELALLEVERANSKHQYDLAEIARKESQKKTLQYMAISLATATLFIILILAGLFPGAALRLVKPLGFVAFICLFEFLILLIDTELHHATHGAPLLIWLAKIAIIGILLPLHHWLEHKVVHFIGSRKLAGLGKRIRPSAWWPAARKEAVSKATVADS